MKNKNLNSFWQAVVLSLSGMATAQVIPLLATLVIARLYGPNEFGVFSSWLGAVMIASVFVTWRFEHALAVVSDGHPRREATVITLITIILNSSALMLIIFIYQKIYEYPESVSSLLLCLFVLATVMAAMSQTWQSWAAAEGDYRKLAGMRIGQALGIAISQISLGYFFDPSAIKLIIGHSLGLLCGLLVSAYLMPLISTDFKRPIYIFNEIKKFWMNYRKFPIYALPADCINTASGQIPLLLISLNFGTDKGGVYALTTRILGAPIGLLGAAVLDVFKRTASRSYNEKGTCRHEYMNTFRILAIGGVLMSLGIIVGAERLFLFAFGEDWEKAGYLAILLTPLFALKFVSSPLSYIFYIAGKQHIDLIWQIVLFLMTYLAFSQIESFEAAVKSYSLGYALLYMVYLILSYNYSMRKSI